MQDPKLEKLKQLLDIANFGMTKGEFTNQFKGDFLRSIKSIVEHVQRMEIKVLEKVNNFINKIESEQSKLRNNTEKSLKDMTQEQRDWMDNVTARIEKLKKGKQGERGEKGEKGDAGRDAVGIDEIKVVQRVVDRINDDGVNVKGVKELEAEVETLKGMVRRKGGGGTSTMGIQYAFKNLLKTEKPGGTINGTNKVFTTTSDIFAVLSFSLNGEVIAEIPNYTVASKTITFVEAIPAAYATKDFEIKYI